MYGVVHGVVRGQLYLVVRPCWFWDVGIPNLVLTI